MKRAGNPVRGGSRKKHCGRDRADSSGCAVALRAGLVAAVLVVLAACPLQAAHAFTFTGPTNTNVPPLTVAHGLQYVAIADFNADADPDLALAHEDGYKVSVLLGGAGGRFGAPADVPLGSSSNPLSVAVGNFNGDSDPDLVTANEGSSSPPPAGSVSILLGGAGGASPPRPISTPGRSLKRSP